MNEEHSIATSYLLTSGAGAVVIMRFWDDSPVLWWYAAILGVFKAVQAVFCTMFWFLCTRINLCLGYDGQSWSQDSFATRLVHNLNPVYLL